MSDMMLLQRSSARRLRGRRDASRLLLACAIACSCFVADLDARRWSAGFVACPSRAYFHAPRALLTSPHRPPRARGARISADASASAAVQVVSGNPLVSDKKGRAGGDGDGDGPTPIEQLQVVVYRFALILTALSWFAIFNLDFAMTSGIDVIDGSLQASFIALADVCAGVAACTVPTGSLIGAALVLRLLGLATIGSTAFASLGLGGIGAIVGPICILLILTREIYWYGVLFRGGNVVSILVFAAIALLRYNALQPQATVDGLPTEAIANRGFATEVPMLVEKQPVGPPAPLSFIASTSLFTTAISKLFEPIGVDLDEEGEMWSKRSSRDLNESGFPSFKPDLSAWLPPVEISEDGELAPDMTTPARRANNAQDGERAAGKEA